MNANTNHLREPLYNLAAECGSNEQNCQGIVNGIVSTFIYLKGYDFATAVKEMCKHLPKDFRMSCIPDPWRAEVAKYEGRIRNGERIV